MAVYSQFINELNQLKRANDFELLLEKVERQLNLDPNNSELLRLKLDALVGLDESNMDIGFLRKICWYRSSDPECWYWLACAYQNLGQQNNALISLAYSLSLEEYLPARNLLDQAFQKLEIHSLNIFFIKSNRIGHLATEADSWLRFSKNKMHSKTLSIFVSGDDICSQSYLDVLARHINLEVNQYFYRVFVSRPYLLSSKFYQSMPYDALSAKRGLFNLTETLNIVGEIYSFSSKCLGLEDHEVKAALEILAQEEIVLSEKYVCVHVRDNQYLSCSNHKINFDYHNFRDTTIENYKLGIEYLLDKGYQIIRIGRATNQYLNIDNPLYLDLHNFDLDNQSLDLLEMFLLSKANFFLGTASGPLSVAATFDVPILLVNVTPVTGGFGSKLKVLPKILSYKGTPLNFIELLNGKKIQDTEKPIIEEMDGVMLSEYGYSYLENNDEDILQAVIEMERAVLNDDFSINADYAARIPIESRYTGARYICKTFIEKSHELFI